MESQDARDKLFHSKTISTKDLNKKMESSYINLLEAKKNQIEEDMAPFGFMDDGLGDTSFVDSDGDRWHTDEYGDMSYMWDYR